MRGAEYEPGKPKATNIIQRLKATNVVLGGPPPPPVK